jgi:thiamine biosynthesis lipoprotein
MIFGGLAACGDRHAAVLVLTGPTMGTQFSVRIPASEDLPDRNRLQQDIDDRLDRVEMLMSTYLVNSEISRFNVSESTDWQETSLDFCLGVEESLAISVLTDGAFDITVGPLVNLWGFGPDGATLKPPEDKQIEDTMGRVGFRHLFADCTIPAVHKDDPRLYLDMSAYAKGYAADRVADLLDDWRLANYLVEIGGELRLRGRNQDGELWAVAIEEPLDQQRRIHATINLTDSAVATSGDYRNFFEYEKQRYSHSIDTRTGRPVTHALASVTVVAKTGAYADAMATALLVLGPDAGLKLATDKGLAALFLVRTPTGFAERSTPAFNVLDRKQ